LTALGVGVVGIGVGTYFGLRARSKRDDSDAFCDADECSDRGLELRSEALDAATLADVGFGIGLVGIGAGIVLLATSGSDAPRRETRWLVTPVAGRDLGGAALRARF
jgi:serine/threonine-protein kinase